MSLPKLYEGRINLRISDKVLDKLKAQAEKRGIILSDHLRRILAKAAA